jgi:CHRD domain
MRSKLLALSFAVLMLGVTACGSSSSSSASSSKTGLSAPKGRGPIRIYRLALAGRAETPPGAANGTGAAVIAFHGSSVVCWRFAHLHGFINATFAHIHIGAKGKSGNIVVPLSTGPALHHQGCVPVSGSLVKAIERDPSGYYVNIHSKRYPGGAVRAQL